VCPGNNQQRKKNVPEKVNWPKNQNVSSGFHKFFTAKEHRKTSSSSFIFRRWQNYEDEDLYQKNNLHFFLYKKEGPPQRL